MVTRERYQLIMTRGRLSLLLLGLLLFVPGLYSDDWDWWPDPATKTGLGVWVAYSKDYALYQDRDFVDQQVAAMQQFGIDVVFVSISNAPATPDLTKLSDRTDPFTRDMQYFLNRLAGQGIRASASLFSDFFTGSDSQMGRYILVDHITDFNSSRNPGDAGFTSVSTDLEMQAGFRDSGTYAKWKQFQKSVRARLAPSGVKFAVWMQAPDMLIDKMDDQQDQAETMARENITFLDFDSRGSIFSGAVRYLTVQDGAAIADAIIPMWYFRDFGLYTFRLDHNVNDLQNLDGDKPFLIAGEMVFDDTCGVSCLQTKEDYLRVLNYNDGVRSQFSSFIGTAIFKWPIPADWLPPAVLMASHSRSAWSSLMIAH